MSGSQEKKMREKAFSKVGEAQQEISAPLCRHFVENLGKRIKGAFSAV